jgi:hypothetical protein
MKRFAIIITETGRDNFDLDEAILLKREHFVDFLRMARRIDVWDDVAATIPMTCDKCKSFTADYLTFYDAICEVLTFVDSEEFEKEFELWETMIGKLESIEERLREEYYEEDDFGESSEIAIIFDSKCTCNSLFTGGTEELETKKEVIDFSEQNGSVSKYIGPKKRWE